MRRVVAAVTLRRIVARQCGSRAAEVVPKQRSAVVGVDVVFILVLADSCALRACQPGLASDLGQRSLRGALLVAAERQARPGEALLHAPTPGSRGTLFSVIQQCLTFQARVAAIPRAQSVEARFLRSHVGHTWTSFGLDSLGGLRLGDKARASLFAVLPSAMTLLLGFRIAIGVGGRGLAAEWNARRVVAAGARFGHGRWTGDARDVWVG